MGRPHPPYYFFCILVFSQFLLQRLHMIYKSLFCLHVACIPSYRTRWPQYPPDTFHFQLLIGCNFFFHWTNLPQDKWLQYKHFLDFAIVLLLWSLSSTAYIVFYIYCNITRNKQKCEKDGQTFTCNFFASNEYQIQPLYSV